MKSLPILIFCLAALAACGGSREQVRADKPVYDGPSMNAHRYSQLEKIASRDLGCDTLTHQYLNNNEHAMRGCDKEGIYTLKCMMGSCRWLPDVRARAEFDLGCQRNELQVTTINDVTRGVSGCGKRATYVMSPTWDSWIMNSVAQ
jgi:hypothetical protein